jgi:hypothetical protein
MDTAGRKVMRSLHHKELTEIDGDILRAVLFDAYKVGQKKFSR